MTGRAGTVTLEQVIVHVIVDLSRHAVAGLRDDKSNLPDDQDWPSYVTRLPALAERLPGS